MADFLRSLSLSARSLWWELHVENLRYQARVAVIDQRAANPEGDFEVSEEEISFLRERLCDLSRRLTYLSIKKNSPNTFTPSRAAAFGRLVLTLGFQALPETNNAPSQGLISSAALGASSHPETTTAGRLVAAEQPNGQANQQANPSLQRSGQAMDIETTPLNHQVQRSTTQSRRAPSLSQAQFAGLRMQGIPTPPDTYSGFLIVFSGASVGPKTHDCRFDYPVEVRNDGKTWTPSLKLDGTLKKPKPSKFGQIIVICCRTEKTDRIALHMCSWEDASGEPCPYAVHSKCKLQKEIKSISDSMASPRPPVRN